MHVLAIDAGTYSVKYISSFLDKRHATHVEMREFPLADAMADNPDWATPEAAMLGLMERVVQEVARPDTKVMLHLPPGMATTRFLTLPVKNRKKAEMMVPFQLEEDIPYALSESHFAWRLEVGKTQSQALVALARQSEFQAFFDAVSRWTPTPAFATTEPSVMDTFYGLNPVAGPFCVLDIGHRTTKAYFFYNGRLIATHVSYLGGRQVDEMIAQTYGIPTEEAVLYKHQNAFVLTQSQMDGVDENQREFARMMDQVYRPLLTDFSRWELGFRVAHGMPVGQVFVCGGSANTKNMAPWLAEKLGVRCALLESFEGVDTAKVDLHAKARAKYTLANMMVLGLRNKNNLINLLSGQYALAGRAELPLHAAAFLATRVAAVTALLALAMVVEGVVLKLDLQATVAKMSSLAKNPVLALTSRERRQLTSNPAQVNAALGKRQRAIRQQISTLQSASDIRALSPLVGISAAAVGTEATLSEFTVSDAGEVKAIFTHDDPAVLAKLQSRIQDGAGLRDAQTRIEGANLLLSGGQ